MGYYVIAGSFPKKVIFIVCILLYVVTDFLFVQMKIDQK